MTDTSTLNQIHEVNGEGALVDAGVSWLELVQAAAPLNLSPPTLTDYLGLRVGGTLSVGGIGGQAALSGLQVDNALELEVVTGRGDRLTFSRRRRPVLFRAVLAGLGQCAVIVRARLRLRPVPPRVRTYTALYGDVHTFTADQERVMEEERFDYLLPARGGALFRSRGRTGRRRAATRV